ncbi:MAG: imidazolonepropionase [Phycisphaerales bacterium]
MSLLIRNARVLTMNDDGAVHDRADALIEGGAISAIGAGLKAPKGADIIDADGRVCMPAFVDAHTHACSAGERLDEWEKKQAGATYLEILESGGGIMSTVRSVRKASQSQLTDALLDRLDVMVSEGTCTVEVKSGYGLSTADELKMLRAITDASEHAYGTVIPTALIAHAKDPDQPKFVETTINETLPAVHAEFPDIAIDAYCERGAWSLEETAALFEKAIELGHPIRVHTDQFNALGMTEWAVERGAVSVDHLEATPPETLNLLGKSGTFGVMLPCSGFHVDGRYGDGRALLDAGGKLVIATNINPGSAPCSSMPMAVALAVRHLGITAHEALRACTSSAAELLGCHDRGVLEPGARADMVLLRHTDERQLGYEFGGNPVDLVVCNGRVL